MTRRLTLALTLIVAATAAAYAQPKEIVIGLIYPMSGPAAHAGPLAAPLTTRVSMGLFLSVRHDGHMTRVMLVFYREFERNRGVKLKALGHTYEDTPFGSDSGKVEKELAAKHGYEVALDLE